MKINETYGGIFTTISALLMLLGSSSFASSVHGYDHGGPSPFDGDNQRVELADGEFYTLYGVIVIGTGLNGEGRQAYLRVDFAKQNWLASAKRSGSPYYPIEGDASFWAKYEHRAVKFPCEAEGRIVTGGDRQQHYVIFLRPYSDRD